MMLRPNYAQDAPPTSLEVGGFCYPVDVDYRTWIGIVLALEDWIDGAEQPEDLRHNERIFRSVQQQAFGGVLADEDPAEVLGALIRFARGYPRAEHTAEGGEALFSFAHDLAEIIIAIRNQSGIDLSYRRKEKFHWWEFLLEFGSLCGDHLILHLMEARAYRGSDAELNRRKQLCALPPKRRAGDAVRLREINRMFYNSCGGEMSGEDSDAGATGGGGD